MWWGKIIICLLIAAEGFCDDRSSSLVKIDIAKPKPSKETANVTESSKENATEVTTTTSTTSTSSTTELPTTPIVTTTGKTVTTVGPATTTKLPEKNSTAADETKVKVTTNRRLQLNLENYYCKCDLKINICDINCCCDIDCTAEIIEAFSCTAETFDSNDWVMGNGLLPCKVQNGLFCVARDRSEEKMTKYIYDERLKKDIKYKWPEIFPRLTNDEVPIKERYQLDDFILMYNEQSKQSETFDLPTTLAVHSTTCQFKQPILFLHDFQSKCPTTIENLMEFNINFIEKMATAKFLKVPKLASIDSDDLLNVTIQTCEAKINEATCTQLNKTEDWFSMYNTGREVAVTLQHNFTHLIKVGLCLVYDDVDLELQNNQILQKLTVNFVLEPTAMPTLDGYAVSGNLGYLNSKPVLVSKLIPNSNKTDEREFSLEFFKPAANVTKLTRLKIPVTRKNYCHLTNDHFATINFGENHFMRCTAPLLKNTSKNCVTPESNLTEICQSFQKELFYYLLHGFEQKVNKTDYSDFNLRVSQFGNPKNNTQHWLPLKRRNAWLQGLDQIDGTVSKENTDFVCQNMMLNIKYDFFFAKLTIGEIKYQQVIKSGELEFGPLVNLQFRFDEEFKVPIFIQIQFHDLTASATMNRGILEKSVDFIIVLSIAVIFIDKFGLIVI